ncbi:hypothetical protein GCM10023147_10080 [Tsukamurella soli]|uniref:MmpS family membrane protein n=2 Tax=Tsukamurella soli TaxID=644556 RepID=A0ABP8J7X7_9ACTN
MPRPDSRQGPAALQRAPPDGTMESKQRDPVGPEFPPSLRQANHPVRSASLGTETVVEAPMNQYHPGHDPGRRGGYPQGGGPRGGYPNGGYPRGGTGYQQGAPGYQQGTPGFQQLGPRSGYGQPPSPSYPQPGGPGGFGPKPPNRNRGLLIGIGSFVVILVIALGILAAVVIGDHDSSDTAAPSTALSEAAAPSTTTTPNAATASTDTAAPGQATVSDGFATPSATPSAVPDGSLVSLTLTAGGSGSAQVTVSGLAGTSVPTTGSVPWSWSGSGTIPDGTLSLVVVGQGTVTCSIAVDDQVLSKHSGDGQVQCGIKRVEQ